VSRKTQVVEIDKNVAIIRWIVRPQAHCVRSHCGAV